MRASGENFLFWDAQSAIFRTHWLHLGWYFLGHRTLFTVRFQRVESQMVCFHQHNYFEYLDINNKLIINFVSTSDFWRPLFPILITYGSHGLWNFEMKKPACCANFQAAYLHYFSSLSCLSVFQYFSYSRKVDYWKSRLTPSFGFGR